MTNIYEILENYFKNKKLKRNKSKRIKQDFFLDLNELDYKKYRDVYPTKENCLTSFLLVKSFYFSFFYFLVYAISDFMNYSIITKYLIILIYPFYRFFIIVLFICILIDLLNMFLRNKYINELNLVFYKRLKNYKK